MIFKCMFHTQMIFVSDISYQHYLYGNSYGIASYRYYEKAEQQLNLLDKLEEKFDKVLELLYEIKNDIK